MRDPLVQHALDNVWQAPEQDLQTIIQPARISGDTGVRKNGRVMWEEIPLPTETGRYHLYSVGHIAPVVLNLPSTKNTWIKLSEASNISSIYVQLYNTAGVFFPLSCAWMRTMDNDNVVLALRKDAVDRIGFTSEDLYFRVYSNAYFDSQRWLSIKPVGIEDVVVFGGVVGQDGFSVTSFINQISATPNKTIGFGKIYHNGFMVSPLRPSTVQAGDTLEYIHDRSIKKVRKLNFMALDDFTSTLDAKNKHIIYPEELGETIEFYDDIDFHVVTSIAGAATYDKGVYYHRNEVDAVRMLTHNAYAIADQYVNGFVADHPTVFTDINDVEIHLYIRHSGWKRSLVDEKNQIKELYKLDMQDVREALTGLNSTVPAWRAENLEQSAFTLLLNESQENIDTAMVADAYGYNAVTKYMSKSVHELIGLGDEKYVNRPPGMKKVGVFTYDINGKLINKKNHLSGSVITVPTPGAAAKTMELIDGQISEFGNIYFGHTEMSFASDVRLLGYRFYACPIVGGVPNQEWIDVTDQAYITVSSDGKQITWDTVELDNLNYYPATKIGGNILFYKVPLNLNYPGFTRFSIAANAYWKYPSRNDANTITDFPITIPYGTLDVFMDGESLVENVDYFVQWPEVVIVKKPPRKPADGLEVWVRCYGFCKSDLSRNVARETGFVRGGMLSADGQWDIRNDRNIRIVAGGKLYRKEQVRFSEDGTGPQLTDGLPYSITDIVAPVEGYLSDRTTEAFRQESLDADDTIQAYLDQYINGVPSPVPVIINGLWDLYSPFVAKIIDDLKGGWLGNGELEAPYNDADIDTWVADAMYLLDYEPTLNGVDMNFVAVHPHVEPNVVSLTIEQYVFVEKVIKRFLNDKVDLTPHVIVGTG